jgi:hypothetical protein
MSEEPMSVQVKRMSVQARALHRAVAVIGGLHQLAGYLKVSDQYIREWMFDVGSPPNGVFLRVIELLLDQPADSAPQLATDGLSVLGDRTANMTRL